MTQWYSSLSRARLVPCIFINLIINYRTCPSIMLTMDLKQLVTTVFAQWQNCFFITRVLSKSASHALAKKSFIILPIWHLLQILEKKYIKVLSVLRAMFNTSEIVFEGYFFLSFQSQSHLSFYRYPIIMQPIDNKQNNEKCIATNHALKTWNDNLFARYSFTLLDQFIADRVKSIFTATLIDDKLFIAN